MAFWNRTLAAAATLLVPLAACAQSDLPLHQIKLPPGFAISVYARVPAARSLALGAQGTVFVGTTGDAVYALADRDRDGEADRIYTVARGLDAPNGVAFRDGALYVAEIGRVLRYDGIEARLDAPPAPAVVSEALPRDRHHGFRFIAFGPDGLLYVPVGAPCNVCEPDPDRYGVILRMKPDGSGMEPFARGVRNTVGFDWDPRSGELWFTDNGRDWLGDELPSCELNHAPKAGMHFGFPYCHQGDLADPEFGSKRKCSEFAPPAAKLGPHVAPLGMRFYTGRMFPPEYFGRVLIAEHGSWNRSAKSGYRVVMADVENGRVTGQQPFAFGWVEGQTAWGRPVDVLVMPDGALLVSDDRAGAVYRVSYRR